MDLARTCGITIAVISALLLIILLPLSFSDLEYYEMGFLKTRTTGTIDTSKVYFRGRHYTGPLKTFKAFRADMHTEKYYKLSIFNKEKIEVTLTCSMQYVLRHEDLHILHDIYDVAYRPVLRATALSAIKAAANQFPIDDYRLERPKVTKALRQAAAKALGGTCCRQNCDINKCEKGCLQYIKCKESDKGLFAALSQFQLMDVSITQQQESRFLRQVLEQEMKETESYIQEERITRKKTAELRIKIENLAEEIAQNSVANSTLITSKARVEAKAMVDAARNKGLTIIYDQLNITDAEHKKSLDYLRTLRESRNADFYVGFQYMVGK